MSENRLISASVSNGTKRDYLTTTMTMLCQASASLVICVSIDPDGEFTTVQTSGLGMSVTMQEEVLEQLLISMRTNRDQLQPTNQPT